jgi:hypothetical protein
MIVTSGMLQRKVALVESGNKLRRSATLGVERKADLSHREVLRAANDPEFPSVGINHK